MGTSAPSASPGSASYTNGTYTVSGAGEDVWGTADAFNYAYQTLSGDGQIVARVVTVANVASWTKAGVMIRGGDGANAAFAFMIVSAGKGAVFQYRTATGAAAAGTPAPGAAPLWLKLVRKGITITAYARATAALDDGRIGVDRAGEPVPDRPGRVEPRQLAAGGGGVRQRQPIGDSA